MKENQNAGKLAKKIGKLMKTAGKTMKKQGTQPRTPQKKGQLNSAPFWISFSTFLAFQHFIIGLIATILNLLS